MPSNLPPGVTESMIPGNRPEDLEWEALFDWIDTVDMEVNEFITAIISYCVSHNRKFSREFPIVENTIKGH